jgi:hypothetical protein
VVEGIHFVIRLNMGSHPLISTEVKWISGEEGSLPEIQVTSVKILRPGGKENFPNNYAWGEEGLSKPLV